MRSIFLLRDFEPLWQAFFRSEAEKKDQADSFLYNSSIN